MNDQACKTLRCYRVSYTDDTIDDEMSV